MRAAKRPLSPQPPARSPFASLPPVQAAVSAILLAERGPFVFKCAPESALVRCLRDHGVGFTEEYPDLSDCGARNWWARLHVRRVTHGHRVWWVDCDVSDVEGQLDQLPALAKFVTARKRAKRVAQAIESYTSASYSGNVDLRKDFQRHDLPELCRRWPALGDGAPSSERGVCQTLARLIGCEVLTMQSTANNVVGVFNGITAQSLGRAVTGACAACGQVAPSVRGVVPAAVLPAAAQQPPDRDAFVMQGSFAAVTMGDSDSDDDEYSADDSAYPSLRPVPAHAGTLALPELEGFLRSARPGAAYALTVVAAPGGGYVVREVVFKDESLAVDDDEGMDATTQDGEDATAARKLCGWMWHLGALLASHFATGAPPRSPMDTLDQYHAYVDESWKLGCADSMLHHMLIGLLDCDSPSKKHKTTSRAALDMLRKVAKPEVWGTSGLGGMVGGMCKSTQAPVVVQDVLSGVGVASSRKALANQSMELSQVAEMRKLRFDPRSFVAMSIDNFGMKIGGATPGVSLSTYVHACACPPACVCPLAGLYS
jgi:hypothetical protein